MTELHDPGVSLDTLRLDALLSLQASVITRRQALSVGLTGRQVDRLLASGRWQAAHRGVHVAFSGPVPQATRTWAGVLAAGAGAAAALQTAAHLQGLIDDPGPLVRVSVPAERRVEGGSGLRVRRDRNLDRKVHPAALPPRTRLEETVLDLVDDAVTIDAVSGWITRACQRRLTTPDRLAAALAVRTRFTWRREVEAMVADVAEGAESPLELQYLRRVERAHGLPRGLRQARRWGRRTIWVDVDLPEFGTRVELGGRTGHVEEGAFRDRRRDNGATVEGRATLRYGYVEVFGTPCEVAAEVGLVVGARGWSGVPRPCGPQCRL